MTADQTNPRTTDKNKTGWKRLVWNVLKGFLLFVLVFFLLFMAYWAWLAKDVITSGFNDYCYLESMRIPNADIFKRDIEWEKTNKLKGWEERVKKMEDYTSDLNSEESFFFWLLTSLCGDLNNYEKPEWFPEETVDGSKEP